MRPFSVPILPLTFSLGLSLLGGRPLGAQACRSGPVSLETRATLQLPPSNGIAGVASSPSGALVLWSPAGEVFTIDAGRNLTRRQLPDSIHPAGVAITPEGLRLYDYSGREYFWAGDGSATLLSVTPLGMAEQIDQAIWFRGAWTLALRDRTTRTMVVRRVDGRERTELFRSAPSDSVRTIERYHLTESSRGLLLTRTMAPFTLIRLEPDTRRVDTLAAALESPGFDIPRDSLASWRALPAVSLDCTLLLTLSDLTGDRRRLLRYGATDQVEQITPLDAPLGLIGRLPGQDAVLAARRTGELELVWYDWHWVGGPSSPVP
jgi:hypothetical protein